MISDLKKKGKDATSIAKQTEVVNEQEAKSKDKQIEQLRKDAELATLRAKITELERERTAKDKEVKKQIEETDPEKWLDTHKDKAKL